MSSNFPTSLDTYTDKTDSVDDVLANVQAVHIHKLEETI